MINQDVLSHQERALNQKKTRHNSDSGKNKEKEIHIIRVKGVGGKHPFFIPYSI